MDNDLISRAALKMQIKQAGWLDARDRSTAVHLINIAPAVDAAPVVHGRWVSVKDRLPEDGESILMIVSGKPTDNITLIGVYAIGEYSDDEGWTVDEYPEWENPNVTCWMPLPPPPKEENDDAKTD